MPAYDGTPIWSPDSRSLAFSSDREGSKDVYIVKLMALVYVV